MPSESGQICPSLKFSMRSWRSEQTTIFLIAFCAVPFVVPQCFPANLHARYNYESWDSTALIWRNTAGPGSNATGSGSGFSKTCRTNVNGASGRVCEVSGTTASVLHFGAMPSSYTLCTVARYTGTSKKRIFTTDCASINWLHGFWESKRGVAYNENWMTSSSNSIPAVETDWLVFCGQNQMPRVHYANDVSVGLGLGGEGNFNFGVNLCNSEKSDFAIMEIAIWFRPLSEEEIRTVSSIYRAVLSGSLDQSFPTTCRPLNQQPRNLARSCGTNSDLDCPTSESSTASWWGMDARAAVDGFKAEEYVSSTAIFYGFHTNTENSPWIRIDLVTTRSIGSGQIWSRPDHSSRLDGFQIWIGDSPTYNGLNNINCYTATITPHNSFPFVHYFPCVGSGRYFFVNIPRTGIVLHLREVEIYPPCSNEQSAVEPHALLAHNYQSIRRLALGTRGVTTVAGNVFGNSGSSDGVGTSARFQSPRGVAVSSDGTFILVADLENRMVRRVDLFSRTVSTVAGSASMNSVSDGFGTSAAFNSPFGIALSPDGAISLVTELERHVIRKITLLTREVTTLAGLASSSGSVDGVGTNCQFNQPAFVAIAPDGEYALVAEWGNHVIRRVEMSSGFVTTLVGTKATSGSADGFGSAARFNKPCGVAISPDGFFALVTDVENRVVRKIVMSTRSVTTLAGAKNVIGSADGRGASSRFTYANHVAISSDGSFAVVTDAFANTIRVVTVSTGDVNTVAGTYNYAGMADGVGLAAQFYNPEGAALNPAVCSTGLFQPPCGACSSGTYRTGCTWTSPGTCVACEACPADQYRSGCLGTSPGTCLCSASPGEKPIVLRNGPSCQCGRLEVSHNGVWGTVCDDFFEAADAMVVCKQLQLASGNVMPTAVWGTGAIWMDNVECAGTEAALSSCGFSGWGSHDCSHSEDVSVCCCTVCQSGQYSRGCSGSSSGTCLSCDACPAGRYRTMCSDSSTGHCTSCLASFALVADSDNHIIRRVLLSSGAVSTLAGTKQVSGSADGLGTSASFNTPHSIAISPDGGSAYVCDTWNHAIRRVIVNTGYVDTLAGLKGTSGSEDGVSLARFDAPVALAIFPDGLSIIVADSYNHVIRVVSLTNRIVSTLAGEKDVRGLADGYGISARFNSPRGIAVSPDGTFALVSDTDNNAIRKVVISSGEVATIRVATFSHPVGLIILSTGLHALLADHNNHVVRQIDISSGTVTTLVGSLGVSGTADGSGSNARFTNPYTVSLSPDGLSALVPEFGNHAIRHIELGTNLVTTLAGRPGFSGSLDGVGSSARFYKVRGVGVPPTSSVCPAGQYLEGCTAGSPGSCVWCSSCQAGTYRVGCARLSAGTCQNCSSCGVGQYNLGCVGLSNGTCTNCQSCPSGQYLRGCSGVSPGVCDVCNSTCNAGQYLGGCSGLSAGSCQPCVTCSSNQYVSGCGGFSSGVCQNCTTCPQGQYLSGCSGYSSGICTTCDNTCPSGTYRRDCGGSSPGTCAACSALTCPGEQNRTGCAGTSQGVCVNPECKVCQANQFLEGCFGSSSGSCMNCSACPTGQYRKDCGGNSSGTCILCESMLCPPGSYRVNCNYTSRGACRTCETCLASNQFRINCSGISHGTCVDCDACPWGSYRIGCLGISGGTCAACNPCPAGMFREQCSGLVEGMCQVCSCSSGFFRSNCSGLISGTCLACESCSPGQYRSACSGINPGFCAACEACPAGTYRDGCGGVSAGSCLNCTQCPKSTFCRSVAGRDSCSACLGCPDGQYRQGCAGISGGSCTVCETCSFSTYRANCSGESRGYCANCSSVLCESENQYRVGCGGLYIGYCALCDSNACPNGMYRTGCYGSSPGSCTSCLPCPPGQQRKGCFGTKAGSCQDCSTPNIYALIADASAHVLRRLTIPSKNVETIAGLAGNTGLADGTGSNARFFNPVVAAFIPAQKITKALLTDQFNHIVRVVDLRSGSVAALAGEKGTVGISDGFGTNVRFNQPFGLAVSSTGDTAYVSEYAGHAIRSVRIGTGGVTTLAGGRGINGFFDGIGTEARFFNPCGLKLALDNRYLFVADSSNHLIRRIDVNTWETITFAGSAGIQGSADGIGTDATFSFPLDVSVSPQADGCCLYVADRDNNKLRRIDVTSKLTVTLKTTPGLSKPSFISLTSDGLFALVSEAGASSIKHVNLDSGLVSVLIEGNSAGGAAQDATGSFFNSPAGITLLPQEPRRVIQITGSAIDYVYSLRIAFKDGDILDYRLTRSDASPSLGEAIQTFFSLEDGECIKKLELKADTSRVQGMSFFTSFGRSISIRGSKYDEGGQTTVWQSGPRECIVGLELEASNPASAQLITNVIKECVSCLAGTFLSAVTIQSGEAEDVCSSCPAGKFSNVSRALECFRCETGTFSNIGATVCRKCETKPQGMFSADGSFNSTCVYQESSRYIDSNESCLWECMDGFYRSADYCFRCRDTSTACAVSEYLSLCSPFENSKCKACYNKPPNSVYTQQGYITSNCSWRCDQNYFFANSTCYACSATPCPTNTYTIPCKESADRICSPCTNFKPPNSIYIGVDRAIPETCRWECSSGFFCSNISKHASCYDANSSCSPCTNINCSGFRVACTALSDASCVDSYCAGRENFYYVTPKNLPTGSPGGSCLPCTQIESANRCEIGFYRSSCTQFEDSTCLACSNGPKNCGNLGSGCIYHSDGNLGNNFSCGWNCDPGMHIVNASCVVCPAGKYETSGNCEDCVAGQYSSSDASVNCHLCAKGKYSTVIGASSVSVCIICEAGKYQDVQGEALCKSCRVNSYSGELGAISDTTCKSCPESPVPTTTDGRVGQIYIHNCLCPKRFLGNLSDYYRHNVNSTDCLACPRGLKCSGDNRKEPLVKNSNWTLNSSFGFVLESCPAGYFYKQDPDFFSSFRSLQEYQECKPCSKGFDCTDPPCQACNMCRLGKFKGCDGTDDCQECPADTYADSNASLECIRCPVGMSTRGLKQRTSVQDCICSENSYAIGDGMDCQICPPGLKCYGNLKDPDPKPLIVASSLDGYILDSSLYVGISNWTQEKQHWKLVYCPPGFRMSTVPEVSYKDQDCVACGRGEDCHPDSAPCSKCSACARGKYKSDRYFYQTKVPRSYFSPQDAAFVREWVVEPCESCPQDTYRNREGGTERGSCTPCPARSTTLGMSGKTSIFDCVCDSQFYMVNLSANDFECQVCPKGAVCSGRSRACALRTSPPSCPCEGDSDGETNSSQCNSNVPGSWIVEQVSRRSSTGNARKTILRLSMCPPGFMLFKDDIYPDLDECQKCISGKYSLLPTKTPVNSGNITCRLCPFGADCPGGMEVTAKSGYWRDFGLVNTSLASIYACPHGACDPNNKCTKNRTGEICGYCPKGFALTMIGCTKCPEPKTLDIARNIVTVLGILCLLALWAVVSWKKIGGQMESNNNESQDSDTGRAIIFEITAEKQREINSRHVTILDNVLKTFTVSSDQNSEFLSLIMKNLKSKPSSVSDTDTDSTSFVGATGSAVGQRMEGKSNVYKFKFDVSGSKPPDSIQGVSVQVTKQFVVFTVPPNHVEAEDNNAQIAVAPDAGDAASCAQGKAKAVAAYCIAQCGMATVCGAADNETPEDEFEDFDHFVIENKVYVSRARFCEALVTHHNTCSEKKMSSSGESGDNQSRSAAADGTPARIASTDSLSTSYLLVYPTSCSNNSTGNRGSGNGDGVDADGQTSFLNVDLGSLLSALVCKAKEIYLIQYCKIFLTYFQILGAFWTFDVDWPDALVSTMKWASYIFQFDLFHAPNISCFWADAPFYLKLMAYTLIPFVACSILYIVPKGIWHYYNFIHKNSNKDEKKNRDQIKKREEKAMDLFWQSTMVLIFFVYPVVSLTVLQAFDCRPGTDTAGNNGLDRLSVNIREKCPGPGSFVRIWAGIFILVYPIGMPVLVFYVMHRLRVREIAEHAVSSEIIISMIREFIQDCTTPEYSRLSTFWNSKVTAEPNQAFDKLVSDSLHTFGRQGIFSPSENEIANILNFEYSRSGQDSSDQSTDIGTGRPSQDQLDSRMQREWNTAHLFTGAENGLLPYLTDLQLEVLFWWSQMKIFQSKYSSLKSNAIYEKCLQNADPDGQREKDLAFSTFKKDSLSKLSKHIQVQSLSIELKKKSDSVPSIELYKAVVKNGHQLIKRFNLAYESPVWSKSRPKHDSGHLQVEERKSKSLYSMSMNEIEEMRYAAVSCVGIVFSSYKMEFWYWELIEMFRK
jgi:DNA-binding beta-propeller fold protein YncE